MPIKCKKGTTTQYRFKKTKTPNTKIRLGGCAKKGRFTKITEVTIYKKGQKVKTRKLR